MHTKTILYSLIVTFLFLTVILNSQVINLSNNAAKSINPRLISNDSVIYALWDDNTDGDFDIYFRMFSDGKWLNTTTINTAEDSHISSLCIEDSTILHLLWIEGKGKNNRLIVGTIVGSTLVDSLEIFRNDTSTIALSSCVYDVSTQQLHVVWNTYSAGTYSTYYAYKTKNGTWSDNQIITNSMRSQLVKDKNNDLLCLSYTGDSVSIEMIKKSLNGWIQGTGFVCDHGGGYNFIARSDDSLNVYLIYQVQATCPCNSLLYSIWNGSHWSKSENIPANNESAQYVEHNFPQLAFSRNNNPIITWQQERYDWMSLKHLYNCIGTAVKTDSGWHVNGNMQQYRKVEYPVIVVDTNDRINYAWQDSSDGDYDIYFYSTPLITSVEIENGNLVPENIILHQNYPNPFNPTTTITFELSKAMHVTLKIFDVLGREVSTLVNEYGSVGHHAQNFDDRNLPSGIYFYRLNAERFTSIKKMLLLK